jgi:predicted transposase/invertase (TIGR01784 family)
MVSNLAITLDKMIEKAEIKAIEKGIEKGMEKGIEQGIEQGMEKEKIEIAKKLISMGMEIEVIMEATGLAEQTINELRKTIQN